MGLPRVISFTFAVVLVALPRVAGAADAAPAPALERDLSRTIFVGVEEDTYPFSFRDKDGAMKGFAVDFASAIARTMDLRLEWRISKVDPNLLQTGEIDVFPLLAETESRRQIVDFSIPVLRLETVVVVHKGNSRVRRLADLAGKRVAVGNPGTVGYNYVHEQHPSATLDFTQMPLAMAMLAQGKFDAVVLSRLTARSEIEHQGLHSLEILDERVVGYDVRRCIAVRRGDALLLARLNEGLAILHRSGEFDRIYNRWLGRYERRTFTWLELIGYIMGLLVVAAGAVGFVLLRQRKLASRVVRQDDELAEQRSLLSALFENQPLATWVLAGTPRETPRLVSWNNQAATLLGLDAEVPAGQPVDQVVVAPEITRLIAEVVSRWHAGSHPEPWETRLASSHRILESTMVSLGLSTSGETRICILSGDVTLRRMADQDAAQSRRLQSLGEMVGGIAHEFNNLLTPITATVGMMRRTFGNIEGLREDLQLVEDAARRAADLTHRLLSFGRKTEIRRKSVYLADVTNNCLALLRTACDRRIEWIAEVPADLRPLDFNPTDLNQILLNLIINARDALQQKLAEAPGEGWTPRIVVRATEEPPSARAPHPQNDQRELLGWQVLTVQDNGPGIPPSIRDRIFEPFFTTKDVGHGTGIGLATVWQLVTVAGGTITVESRVGEGTAFHVVLPRWQRQTSIRPSSKPPPVIGEERKLRVFLAEDERLLARACTRGLVGLGHQVTHVVDGLDAWTAFEKGAGASHDVLLTDVNMPRMGGLDLIRKIRTTGFRGRVIVMSGRVDSVSSEIIKALQLDYVLAKPFDINELLTAIADGRPGSCPPSS